MPENRLEVASVEGQNVRQFVRQHRSHEARIVRRLAHYLMLYDDLFLHSTGMVEPVRDSATT